MAIEPTPVTVFTLDPDPAAVIAVLRTVPGLLDLRVDGSPDDWREAHVTLDDPNAARRVVVRNDPSYWQRPGFDQQLAGMQQFLGRGGIDRVSGPRIESLGDLGYAVSISGDDGQRQPYLHQDDPAGRLAALLATELDGVLFWISGLYDARFRMLLGGPPNPEATPPSWMPDPPDPRRVARRLLVLVALHLRSQLEELDDPGIDCEAERARLVAWISSGGFGDEFEDGETSPTLPCGSLTRQQTIDDWWSIEGAATLGWALGLVGYPPDQPSDVIEQLADAVGWPHGVPAGFVEQATVRSDDELRAAQDHQFFWHWRFVDQRINPRHMDFANLGRSPRFARFVPGHFRMVDGDLAVGDVPIDRAEPATVSSYSSTAMERHRAVNWLRRGGEYGGTDTST